MDSMTSLHRAAELIANADALVIGAGAGMGVDSGLPDFRGASGLWTSQRIVGNSHLDIMELASPKTFEADAALVWGFYGERLEAYRHTQPHAGFEILKRWSQSTKYGAWIFTSNVDGQFQKAGFDPAYVEECHGSIHYLQCIKPCKEAIWSAEELHPIVDKSTMFMTNPLPRCPYCGGLARPNVLMFNDDRFVYNRTTEQRNCRLDWLSKMTDCGARIVTMELGAGTTVVSVRHFSFLMDRDHNAPLIRINIDDALVEQGGDVGLAMSAADALLRIDEVLCRKSA